MLRRYLFRQNRGVVIEEVKPKIVFPNFDARTPDESGNPDDIGWLPNDKIFLCGESGGPKVRVPIQARRLRVEVGAFPRIVLFEGVGRVGVRSESSGNSYLE